jgi:hypothetical protein
MNNAITYPATGDTTPAKKRQQTATTAIPVTPSGVEQTLILALRAATKAEAAKAANAAAAAFGMDTEPEVTHSDDDDETIPKDAAQPEPVLPRCSMMLLPPAFNSFANTISKKVSALMMSKRAKLRVILKLKTREIIPTSIRFNFELSGSKEVTGTNDFFGLAASCSMAIQTCQEDLKNSMAQAAQMEVDVIDQKSRATFH